MTGRKPHENIDPFDCALDDQDEYPRRNSDASTAAAIEAVIEEDAIVESGRKEGREAGLREGFRDGRLLGQKTGVEYGMEIGFAIGLLEAVRQSIDAGDLASLGSLDRITKSTNDLEKAIQDFPSSKDSIKKRLFQSSQGSSDMMDNNQNDSDDEHLQRLDGSNEEDVRTKLQRIRARCKVLAAKLGIPHHSLKTILAESSRNKTAIATSASMPNDFSGRSGDDQDW